MALANLLFNNNNNNNEDNDDNHRRANRGRQKIEMIKMANESNLQVTFSKRRSGLFKKASELCTLCGAEVALVVFSPGRKVFSFGHPSVEAVIERYVSSTRMFLPEPPVTVAGALSAGVGAGNGAIQLIEAHRNANVRDFNVQLTQVVGLLDDERRRGDEMNRLRKARQIQCWWENPVEEMDMAQLGQMKSCLLELRKLVNQHADRILIHASNTINNNNNPPAAAFNTVAPPPPPPQFYPAAAGSAAPRGGSGMMVPYNNMTNNNPMVNPGANHGIRNMPTPALPPAAAPPQPQQNPSSGFNNNNNVGYGGRGFY